MVVGVAAIVGLQLTADILERSLTTSVRSFLRGDVSAGKGEPQEGGGAFTASELAQVQALVDEGLIDGFTTRGTPSSFADYTKFKTSILGRSDKDATLSLFTPVFFERDVFPYYGVVQADGQGLWDMIQDDFDVVVTSTLANRHDINVSDQLKLSGIDQPFNVKGILPGSALGRSGDPLSGNVVFSQATIDRALANDPPLLLCDEPTGALDTVNGDLVMNTLFQAQRDLNTAVVIVTHDPRIAARADRRLVMTDGRFVDES